MFQDDVLGMSIMLKSAQSLNYKMESILETNLPLKCYQTQETTKLSKLLKPSLLLFIKLTTYTPRLMHMLH